MSKNVIMKMVLLIIVVVLANIYMGCVQTGKKTSAEELIRLKQLEINQQTLMQQMSAEQKEEMDALRKEIEELKKQR